MLGLLLVGAGVLVGQSSYITVRQRRHQLAVLRALGWSPWRLAALVELETLVLGVAGGLASLLIALPVAATGHAPILLVGVTPPVGVAIAGLAALPAAWTASRGSAITSMSGGHRVRTSHPLTTTAGLAGRELCRAWPLETCVGAFAVALGAGLVGVVVLVAAGFRSHLDTTVLGAALDTRVRPFHLILTGLTLALGSTSAAQVVLLGWLSRRHHLGVLRALGWSGVRLASYVCCQALIVGLAAAAIAGPAVLACAELLNSPAGFVSFALAATFAGCATATVAAAVGPGLIALRSPARRLLDGA